VCAQLVHVGVHTHCSCTAGAHGCGWTHARNVLNGRTCHVLQEQSSSDFMSSAFSALLDLGLACLRFLYLCY
jgi:hypothetical protein